MRWPLRAVCLAMCLAAPVSAQAQSSNGTFQVIQAESKLSIVGSSNLHDWSCTASTFDGRIEMDSTTKASADGEVSWAADRLRQVRVRVLIRNLKCGNTRMESDLKHALHADDPTTSGDIVASFAALPGAAAPGATIETMGEVAVGGVSKAVHITIVSERIGDGRIKATGTVPLLMTDFGVKPPTGLFGLIRSRNEITVAFTLVIRPPP